MRIVVYIIYMLVTVVLLGVGSLYTVHAQVSNVSHVQNGNIVRILRSSDGSSARVDGALLSPESRTFQGIGSATETSFMQFAVQTNGEHTIRLTPYGYNGQRIGNEITYTFTIMGLARDPNPSYGSATPGITHVPRVGPERNILLTIGIIFILYGLYRWRKTARA